MDLAKFLEARIGDDEAAAWTVHNVAKCDAMLYEEDMAAYAAREPVCDCGYPARVLREVEAKRAIMTFAAGLNSLNPGHGDLLYERLAEIWNHHPEYDEGAGR